MTEETTQCVTPGSGHQQLVGLAPSVSSASAGGLSTHFERIGGDAVIADLVDRFYLHMDGLPQAATIRALHPMDLSDVKRVFRNFLSEWMGGPQIYSVERGHPRLRRKHLAFPIGDAERDAWMACMRAALNDVVGDPALKGELDAAFWKTADFIRNQKEST